MMLGRLTGVGIAYPRGRQDHAWVGRRMPDLSTVDGRLYQLMRDGRLVLLTSSSTVESTDRVRVVRSDDERLPAESVLVRPDGYVAWAGSGLPSLDHHNFGKVVAKTAS